MKATPWFERYDDLRREIDERREIFHHRCQVLGITPATASPQLWKELISRAVHESNWQEGLYLDEPRTRELTDEAFDNLPPIHGPHLDLESIIESHRKHVTHLKQRGDSLQEIAAYNLSTAYYLIHSIFSQLKNRQLAGIVSFMEVLSIFLKVIRATPHNSILYSLIEANLHSMSVDEIISSINDITKILTESEERISEKFKPEILTSGQLFTQLINLGFENLVYPMHISYIHCFHRITLMGITLPRYLGTFRKVSVNVGDPNVYFPPPLFVPGLMNEFCQNFPWVHSSPLKNYPIHEMQISSILPREVFEREEFHQINKVFQMMSIFLTKMDSYDEILKSAEVSYKFVHIHPYRDGNGRVSRILMNLILNSSSHPPVHLKSNSKNRRRYIWALHRANRGNIKPLACLIALSLKENYDIFISTLNN